MSFHTYAQCAKRKKKILGALKIILIFITAYSLAMIGQKIAASREIAREEQAAADKHQTEYEAVVDELPDASLEQNLPAIQPQILDLMNQNTDAVGLLHFEEDRTLYVCQTTNSSYYINHRFDGSEDPAGMIYMDYRCTQLPRSDNLILYGHNMRDGSRFGTSI